MRRAPVFPFDAPGLSRRRASAGFTLVELVVLMILIGILAITMLPRFAERSVFESQGFRAETVSRLRYAQKAAVAQRRTVCVAVNGNGVALTVDTAAVPDGGCDAPLSLPSSARGGSGLGGSGFNFLASGATGGSGTLELTVDGADPIKIDAVTGYVR